jgi:hypothetical protein
LAGVNRRPHPTLISGVGDFAAALLGLSGFLIVGGPMALAGLHSAWRLSVFRGSFDAVGALLDEPIWPWLLLWAAYFAVVVIGALSIYRRRRTISVICHVEPAAALSAVSAACGRLHIPISGHGARLILGGAARSAVLDVQPSPILRSVTLAWHSDPAEMRPIVEGELRRILRTVASPASAVAVWLLTAATVLFVAQLVAFFLLGLFLYYARH